MRRPSPCARRPNSRTSPPLDIGSTRPKGTKPALATFLGYPGTHVETAVSDGVWILLAPMSRGQHTIHFTAASTNGFQLDITYSVTVP